MMGLQEQHVAQIQKEQRQPRFDSDVDAGHSGYEDRDDEDNDDESRATASEEEVVSDYAPMDDEDDDMDDIPVAPRRGRAIADDDSSDGEWGAKPKKKAKPKASVVTRPTVRRELSRFLVAEFNELMFRYTRIRQWK